MWICEGFSCCIKMCIVTVSPLGGSIILSHFSPSALLTRTSLLLLFITIFRAYFFSPVLSCVFCLLFPFPLQLFFKSWPFSESYLDQFFTHVRAAEVFPQTHFISSHISDYRVLPLLGYCVPWLFWNVFLTVIPFQRANISTQQCLIFIFLDLEKWTTFFWGVFSPLFCL